jgi:hypothetical protein
MAANGVPVAAGAVFGKRHPAKEEILREECVIRLMGLAADAYVRYDRALLWKFDSGLWIEDLSSPEPRTALEMAGLDLYVLPLDGGEDDIFRVNVKPEWDRTSLRPAIGDNFAPYKYVGHNQNIQMWALERYLGEDAPDLSKLDTNIPAYNGAPLVKIRATKAIVSYFPQQFEIGDDKKMHLVVVLGMGFALAKPALCYNNNILRANHPQQFGPDFPYPSRHRR